MRTSIYVLWMEKLWKFYEAFSCCAFEMRVSFLCFGFFFLGHCDDVECFTWLAIFFLNFCLRQFYARLRSSDFSFLWLTHFISGAQLTLTTHKKKQNKNQIIDLLVHFDPIRYLSILLFRMKSLVLLMPQMWMACLDGHADVVVAAGRLCQPLTMPIDGTHTDIDANQPVQCPRVPHKNQTVSSVASNPKTKLEQLETFVCNEKNRKKKQMNTNPGDDKLKLILFEFRERRNSTLLAHRFRTKNSISIKCIICMHVNKNSKPIFIVGSNQKESSWKK